MRRCSLLLRAAATGRAAGKASPSSTAEKRVDEEVQRTVVDGVVPNDTAAPAGEGSPDEAIVAAAARNASDARWRAQHAADAPAATGGTAGDKLAMGRMGKSDTPFVSTNFASYWLTVLSGGKLKPLTRTQLQARKEIHVHVKTAARLTPYNIEMYIIGSFLIMYMGYYGWNMKEPEDSPGESLSPEARMARERANDPNRTPWPILHKQATEIREGKVPPDEVQKIWEQVKHYYDSDWLVIVELTQFLKYSSGKFLKQFIDDPEKARKEMMVQLMNVKYKRVVSHDNIGEEAREIIDIALEDLGRMSFVDIGEIPLVPTHSAQSTN